MNRRFAMLLLLVSLASVGRACAEQDSLGLDALFGWTGSLSDYFLTGDPDPLDLSGPISGSTGRLEIRADRGRWFGSMLLTVGGSYALTGGSYDVLRLADLFIGARGGISLFSFLEPHLFAGGMYSDYVLLVPYHEYNSVTLHMFGFRVGGGVDVGL